MKRTIHSSIRRFVRATRGANLVEYLLLVGVVALIGLGGYRAFGAKLSQKVTEEKASVDGINTQGATE